ncbi:MAG: nitroimidazol reductase NimA-like FMN-containing flavoprotein [Haloarculaceae archaeon]|jgi:nitroimidazol reductase NimA-like FMN-containing flavoprotein (pyridoxamine 5'-phosphate oxidase superfamily)
MPLEYLEEYGLEQMNADEMQGFLSSQSTGVLGFSTDDVPYMIPMSYAFDEDSIYFTYLIGSDSQKETLTEQSERAGFLVYNVETMFNWQSVLVSGPISSVPEAEWSDLEELLASAWRPELFQSSNAPGQVGVYELEIDDRSGIRHTGLAPGFREGVEY